MVQRYEPAVRQGDKRIILVDGEPMGAVNRVPAEGEARSNMHVGGRPEKSHADRARPRDLRRDRPDPARAGPDLRRHRRDRRLADRDQRHLADRDCRRSTGSTACTSRRRSGTGSRRRSKACAPRRRAERTIADTVNQTPCHCEERSDLVIARNPATLSLRGAQRRSNLAGPLGRFARRLPHVSTRLSFRRAVIARMMTNFRLGHDTQTISEPARSG